MLAALAGTACSSSGGAGGGAVDGVGDDAATGCPTQQPSDRASCSGSATCTYGHSTCCGVNYSAFTCKCQMNAYLCAQTVECNFGCPDASD
jgi:hypothetical protein